jgi:hypothetical protein
MRTLHKITSPFLCLVLFAACTRPLYGGSAPAGEASSAPPAYTAPAGTPSTPLRSAGTSDRAVAIRPSSAQSLSRLYSLAAANPGAAVPVLVVPAKEMSPEAYDRVAEDLNIMNRIFQKSVTEAPELYPYDALRREVATLQMLQHTGYMSPWQGDKWIFRSSSGRPRPLYIGGYGAVFSFQVSFPLVPPPETPKPDQTGEPMDQVWAAAQRELANPQAVTRALPATSQGEPYRQEAVEGLKSALTEALKHATNIRDLEPDAWLLILVQGPSPTVPSQSPNPAPDPVLVLPAAHAGGRTLLTLRAKKADIDQYAKGQLDDTQFQQRVQIVIR